LLPALFALIFFAAGSHSALISFSDSFSPAGDNPYSSIVIDGQAVYIYSPVIFINLIFAWMILLQITVSPLFRLKYRAKTPDLVLYKRLKSHLSYVGQLTFSYVVERKSCLR